MNKNQNKIINYECKLIKLFLWLINEMMIIMMCLKSQLNFTTDKFFNGRIKIIKSN